MLTMLSSKTTMKTVMKMKMAKDGAQLRLRPGLVAAAAGHNNIGGIEMKESERCPTERDNVVVGLAEEAGHRVWGGRAYYLFSYLFIVQDCFFLVLQGCPVVVRVYVCSKLAGECCMYLSFLRGRSTEYVFFEE